MAGTPPTDPQEALPAGSGLGTVTCPVCAKTVTRPGAFCPSCLSLLDSACESCGQPLRVRRVRVRVSNAVRLALELLGAGVIVFTLPSIVGPLIGILIILIAERFGYRTEIHQYCPSCRLHQHAVPSSLPP